MKKLLIIVTSIQLILLQTSFAALDFFDCKEEEKSTFLSNKNYRTLCRAAISNDICERFPKSDLKNCNSRTPDTIDWQESLLDCLQEKITSLKELWIVIKRSLTYLLDTSISEMSEELSTMVESLQLYFAIELDKVISELKGPFKDVRAGIIVSKNLFFKFFDMIAESISDQVDEFSCLNSTAQVSLGCTLVTDILLTSAGVSGFFKYGPKFLKSSLYKIPKVKRAALTKHAKLENSKHIDRDSLALLLDKSRKPKVSQNGLVKITHGKNKGTTRKIINFDKANKTERKEGYTRKRDANGFIIFNSKFDTYLPKKLLGNSDSSSHIEFANSRLKKELSEVPGLAKKMGLTKAQKEYFLKDNVGKSTPNGLVWHHHQDLGRMQLLNFNEHDAFIPHTGGMSIWGGGYKK